MTGVPIELLRSTPGRMDSVEKLVHQLNLCTLGGPVRYGKKNVGAQTDQVSIAPSLFRKFTCVEGCSACCCVRITLDFLPSEIVRHVPAVADTFNQREIAIDDRVYTVYTNDQTKTDRCDFLTKPRGDGFGCAMYGEGPGMPLSCISAPQLQFIQVRPGHTYVMKKPFGRAWAMAETPQCEFDNVPLEEMDLETNVNTLHRYEEWAAHFGMDTVIPKVSAFIAEVAAGRRPVPAATVSIASVSDKLTLF